MLDVPWKYYAKWKEAVTKDPILCDSTDTKCPEKGHLHSQGVESWFPQAGKIRKGKLAQGDFFGGWWKCSNVVMPI